MGEFLFVNVKDPISIQQAQLYCERCRRTYWVEYMSSLSVGPSGLRKKSFVHGDHVLIAEIDAQGSVRGTQIVETEFDAIEMLIEDVAQGFLYVNSEPGPLIKVDFFTSNDQLRRFVQSIIIRVLEYSTRNMPETKAGFAVNMFEKTTTLVSDRINLYVGPYEPQLTERYEDAITGVILDIEEVEKKKLQIEKTLDNYAWVGIFVQPLKKQGYANALGSYLKNMKIPYFIQTLNNDNLRDLFDFIFSLTIEAFQND